MNDKDFLKIAIEESNKSYDGIGALVVRNGKIISIGHNLSKEEIDPTSHAEVVAIRKACKELGTKYLENCVLYSTFEPCFMCFDAASWSRIKKVVYGQSRKNPQGVTYHTNNFTIHDLNSHFDKPLEIVEIKQLYL